MTPLLAVDIPTYLNNPPICEERRVDRSLYIEQENKKIIERKITQKKEKILALPKGWDEGVADPISSKQWKIAENFLKEKLSKFPYIQPPKISPVPNGEILIHWKNKRGEMLSVLVGKTIRYSFFDSKTDNTERGGEKNITSHLGKFTQFNILSV